MMSLTERLCSGKTEPNDWGEFRNLLSQSYSSKCDTDTTNLVNSLKASGVLTTPVKGSYFFVSKHLTILDIVPPLKRHIIYSTLHFAREEDARAYQEVYNQEVPSPFFPRKLILAQTLDDLNVV